MLFEYFKEEVCGGLVVLEDGEKFQGIVINQKIYFFLGEFCIINGKDYGFEDLL